MIVLQGVTPETVEQVVSMLNMGYTRKHISKVTKVNLAGIARLKAALGIGRKSGESRRAAEARYFDSILGPRERHTNP